jgi:L-arabinonolactonase
MATATSRPVGTFRAELGESPVWCAQTGCVWWLDIARSLIVRTDPSTGRSESFHLPARPGCIAPAHEGLIVTLNTGIWLFRLDTPLEKIAPNPCSGSRMNDGAVDTAGRLWLSTLAQQGGDGRVHCLTGDRVTPDVVTGLGTPNGIAFSHDGARMYVSDSKAETQGIWVFDYDAATGTPTHRRPFFDTAGKTGRPDGATVDAAGRYWFAAVGGGAVVCLNADGTIEHRFRVPASRPTKPVFGGMALDRLYLTTIGAEGEPHAGALLEIRSAVLEGAAPARFRPAHDR